MSLPSSTKKIRSQPPDVIVAVGSGEDMQEFECYKVVLSFASQYFDAMLSADMSEKTNSRIEFPDKNPDEWEIFYKCIDPGTPNVNDVINKANVRTLVPWFHHFDMKDHLIVCDKILTKLENILSKYDEEERGFDMEFWGKQSLFQKRKNQFGKILELYQFAKVYGMETCMDGCGLTIQSFLGENFESTYDLFDFSCVRKLLDLEVPLEKRASADGKRKVVFTNTFWRALPNDFKDKIVSGSVPLTNKDLLAVIIQTSLELRHKDVQICHTRIAINEMLTNSTTSDVANHLSYTQRKAFRSINVNFPPRYIA
jgi:hypothetical protein